MNLWYEQLNKSSLTPPNCLFSPVWSFLYLLIGISIINYLSGEFTKIGILLFIIQLILNFIWTPVFFGQKDIKLAFFILINLVIFVLFTINEFMKTNQFAGYLLVPYFIWLLLALYLNYYIVINN